MTAGDRERQRRPDAGIRLAVVALHPVDGRAPAPVVRAVDRAPERIPEPIDGVALHGVDGILFAAFAVEEVVVGGEDGDARRDLEDQRAERLRDPELGLEEPAMAADVDGPRVVVLSEWCRDLHAHADDHVLLVGGELLERQRRRPVEIDREAEAGIGEAVDLAVLRHSPEERGSLEPAVGHDHVGLGRRAEEAERARVREDGAVDVHLPVLERQGRIGRDVARQVGVSRDQEVEADRRIGVRARLQILRVVDAREEYGRERGREQEDGLRQGCLRFRSACCACGRRHCAIPSAGVCTGHLRLRRGVGAAGVGRRAASASAACR